MGGGKLLSAILIFLLIIAVSACQNDAPKAADLRIHIIDGLSSSKTVMPDGFRGVDRYELVITDQSGSEIARSTATGSVDALVSGIVPGQYTITVKGYADIGSEPVLIINDSQPLTVKEGMTEVSVAVSGIAEGTGTVDLLITADMPEGYTFADDAVTVRLYDGGEAVYQTTVGYTAADGVMTARLENDIEAGVYTAEVQVDELYGRAMLYVLPGMTSTGTMAVNPMVTEKVAKPVIGEVEENEAINENNLVQPKIGWNPGWGNMNFSMSITNSNGQIASCYYSEGEIVANEWNIPDDFSLDSGSIHITVNGASGNDSDILSMLTAINGISYYLFRDVSLGNNDPLSNDFDNDVTLPKVFSEIDSVVFYVRDSNGNLKTTSPEIPVKIKSASMQFKITCETQGAEIYYTLDGNEPSELSILYTGPFEVEVGATIKARAFKDGMMPSDVTTYEVEATVVPVTVPMTLPDGSVLFYDRGEEYGSYHIDDDGYPVRDDGAVDDGTAESKNWRYLITLPCDLNYYDSDYSGSWDERGRCSPNYSELAIGSGLSNSISIIKENASDDWSFYGKQLWDCIKDYRDSTGIEWFVPSIDELSILYGNKNGLNFDESDDWYSSKYWSSSVYSDAYAWYIDFSTGEKDYTGK